MNTARRKTDENNAADKDAASCDVAASRILSILHINVHL